MPTCRYQNIPSKATEVPFSFLNARTIDKLFEYRKSHFYLPFHLIKIYYINSQIHEGGAGANNYNTCPLA